MGNDSSSTIADVIESIIDNRGKTPPYEATGIPLIDVAVLAPNRKNPSFQNATKFVGAETYKNWFRNGHPVKEDILFATVGSLGNLCLMDSTIGCIAQNVVALRVDKSKCIPSFFYYLLKGKYGKELVKKLDIGGVQPSIKLPHLLNSKLELPPLQTQQAIAHILGTFDDKIELLRSMNETLEAMARALFKSWFIDFDPVRKKAEGQPTGLPPEIDALFPDSFEDSELGEIPKGWQTDSIYHIAKVIYGAPFSSSMFNAEKRGTPLVRIRDLKDENPEIYTEEVHPKGYLLKEGDIVVGMDGEFRAYLWGGKKSWLNQRVCVFQPKDDYPIGYVYFAIQPLLAEVEATETATTVIHIGKNDIDRFKVCLPPISIIGHFAKSTDSMVHTIVNNKHEIRILEAMRDSLLPKLVSGEIELSDKDISKIMEPEK
ncbi:MAG: restriction endonuclease subunit S [Spirochaetales bacterium]|nr:restriction endonuclease subunit S [Spirochaetales bacterium]